MQAVFLLPIKLEYHAPSSQTNCVIYIEQTFGKTEGYLFQGQISNFVRKSFLSTYLFFFILLAGSLPFGSTGWSTELPKFTIITEEWPPYQFEQDGDARGISVDILLLMLEQLHSTQGKDDIKFYPWVRGYQTALNQKNTLLFLLVRTSKRENMFKWVGPLFEYTTCLAAKKERRIVIHDDTELGQYYYGAIRDDVGEQLLREKGVGSNRILSSNSDAAIYSMLQSGRVDMIPTDSMNLIDEVQAIGADPDEFECIYTLNVDDVSFAFDRQTSDDVVAAFQSVFDRMRKDGKIKEIFDNYQDTSSEK